MMTPEALVLKSMQIQLNGSHFYFNSVILLVAWKSPAWKV